MGMGLALRPSRVRRTAPLVRNSSHSGGETGSILATEEEQRVVLRTHGTIERLPRGHRILGAVAVCAIAVGLSSCGSAPSQSDNPGASVADVSSGMGSPLGSNRLGASSRARVRNESSSQADVVMQFVRDSRVIHEAFARVLPNTVTTVTSPANIDYVELSGIDGRGDALAKEVFVFGVDFDSGVPAEYVIFDADDPLAGSAIPPIEMQRARHRCESSSRIATSCAWLGQH